MGSAGIVGQLRKLGSHSLVYGAADVFGNLTSLLLIPVFTAFLAPADYRDLAVLALFSAVAKILFRLGLDGGFFRVYYEREGAAPRLAGSVALFAALVAGALLAVVWAGSEPLTRWLLGARPTWWVTLAAADVALSNLAFVPLGLLRIQDRPGRFSLLASLRHGVNIALKVWLVATGHGVAGVLWSDVLATGLFALLLLPELLRGADFRPDRAGLRAALGFGVPKVPHGFMVQVQNLADRKLLDLFVSQAEVGLYHVAYTLATGVKFALSSFEPAWQPFVYSEIAKEGASRTLARVVSYAWLAFAAVGLVVAALAREGLTLLTPANTAYRAAAPVIPVVVLAYLLHGVFLLTSIGIGVRRKTGYYPLITAASATVNVAANLLLIPRYGMMGAAWATVASYAVMAGLGLRIGQHLYPLPLEWGRLARVAAAALASFALAQLAPEPPALPPGASYAELLLSLLPALLARAAALVAFPALLYASGFLTGTERAWLRARLTRAAPGAGRSRRG